MKKLSLEFKLKYLYQLNPGLSSRSIEVSDFDFLEYIHLKEEMDKLVRLWAAARDRAFGVSK